MLAETAISSSSVTVPGSPVNLATFPETQFVSGLLG